MNRADESGWRESLDADDFVTDEIEWMLVEAAKLLDEVENRKG